MYYYRDAARFRLPYLIMQAFQCFPPGFLEIPVLLAIFVIQWYNRGTSFKRFINQIILLFLSTCSPAINECINATRITLFPSPATPSGVSRRVRVHGGGKRAKIGR